ncbi:hypothetical protein BVRB_3g062830 [Beta vulgaris subsp. vulgaris]|nr:hypothetical protein BVRB_3g062830 [Beta vulgaris subsp. vulgaris]
MLAVSPLCPNLGWEYPIELGTNQEFDNFDFESIFFNNSISSSQAQDDQVNQEFNDVVKQSESPQGTSSIDHSDNPVLAKKLNHNASERDRRKKINDMYMSLRALLPSNDQRKKLSIPATVGRVLEYIPKLQKEVDDLTHKKDVLSSKLSALEGNIGEFIQDEKPKNSIIKEKISSCTISANKLGDKELVIQVSAFEKVSISEVLLLLEKNGYVVIDISCFQSFGGTTFYNLHLWMNGNYNVNLEKMNEVLLSLLQKQQQMQMMYVYS